MFTTSGRTITFPGFLRAYVEDTDERVPRRTTPRSGCRSWPAATRSTRAASRPTATRTSPPARYTEPSLVKAMEELGVGRPSTYASIMQTIQDRGYVWKKGPALVPTWTAFAVVGLLEAYFSRLVDYDFTASVENDLDDIANGERSRVDWLRRFYFGAETDAADKRAHLRAGRPQAAHRVAPGRDRRARGELDPGRQRRSRRARRPLRPVPAARRGRGHRPRLAARGPRPGRADDRTRSRSCSRRRPATSSSARRPTGARSPRGPAATARTSPTARTPRRCSSRCRSTRSPRRRPSSC